MNSDEGFYHPLELHSPPAVALCLLLFEVTAAVALNNGNILHNSQMPRIFVSAMGTRFVASNSDSHSMKNNRQWLIVMGLPVTPHLWQIDAPIK